MIAFRVRSSRSWLSAQFGRSASRALAERLIERCQGEKGLFLTLTYKRDEYEDPQDLYRRASEEQHVPMFIRKLCKALGRSLRGQWMCKLEFQKGGWVHWHLLVLGVTFIPHDVLTACWDRGHVWVEKMNPRSIYYVCKYVSKDGDLPTFLYLERSRSVKIVRVSPGFWKDTVQREPYESPWPAGKMPFYLSIGEVLERAEGTVQVMDPQSGNILSVRLAAALFLAWLFKQCPDLRAEGYKQGWCYFSGADVRILDSLPPLPGTGGAGGVGAAPPGSAGGEAAGFHLNTSPNPDFPRKWVGKYFEWAFGWWDDPASGVASSAGAGVVI